MKLPIRIETQLEDYSRQWSRSSGMRRYSKSSRWKRKGDIEALEWVLELIPINEKLLEEKLREKIEELRERLKTENLFPVIKYKTQGWIRSLKWVLR